jgi:hypothetical protein
MEPVKPSQGKYLATDITIHGRSLRPTQKFENSLQYGPNGSVVSGRVYGVPTFVIDPVTKLVYFGHQFSPEVTQKFIDGTIAMPKGISIILDKVAQDRLKAKEKGRLKNWTRWFRK